MTTEQQLLGECDRLAARLAPVVAAGLRLDELITRYIARKMHQLGVADAELRRTVTARVRRRFNGIMSCCVQVGLLCLSLLAVNRAEVSEVHIV